MELGTGLSKIFTGLALAGVLLGRPERAGAQTAPPSAAAPTSSRPVFPAVNPFAPMGGLPDTSDYRALWSRIVREDSHPYDFGRHKNRARADASRTTRAVQAETAFPDILAFLLSRNRSPLEILHRHGEAAAAILNNTADHLAGEDVDVKLIEPMESADTWFYNPASTYARALFSQNDFISWSMKLDQNDEYSAGELNTEAELAAADEFFRQWGRQTVIVVSAGNDGESAAPNEIERPAATMIQRARLLLETGEAEEDRKGYYVTALSSPSAPSVVIHNPWKNENFAYPFYRSGSELNNYLNTLSNYRVSFDGQEMSVGEAFEQILNIRANYIRQDSLRTGAGQAKIDSLYNPLSSCHPAFRDVGVLFSQKDRLSRDPIWQGQHGKETLESFMNCLRKAAADIQQDLFNQFGEVRGLTGTSWSNPYAAGLMAGAYQEHPVLSKEDVLAAALLAAEPAARMALPDGGFHTLAYSDNGRGLPVNLTRAGFGILLKENYEKTIEDFLQILKEFPEKTTRPASVETGWISCSLQICEVPVSQNILALRVNVALKFEDKEGDGKITVPGVASITSPAFGYVVVSPSVRNNMEVSMLSTDYLFGNTTEGIWKIQVPANSSAIEAIKLNIEGVDLNGVIDEYFRRFIDPQQPVKPDNPGPLPQRNDPAPRP